MMYIKHAIDGINYGLEDVSYIGCAIYGQLKVLSYLDIPVPTSLSSSSVSASAYSEIYFPAAVSFVRDFSVRLSNTVEPNEVISIIGSDSIPSQLVRRISNGLFGTSFVSGDRGLLYKGSDLLDIDLELLFIAYEDIPQFYNCLGSSVMVDLLRGAPVSHYLGNAYATFRVLPDWGVRGYSFFYSEGKEIFNPKHVTGVRGLKSLLRLAVPPKRSVFGTSQGDESSDLKAEPEFYSKFNMSYMMNLRPVGVSLFLVSDSIVKPFFKGTDFYISNIDIDFESPILKYATKKLGLSFYSVKLELKSTSVVGSDRIHYYFNLVEGDDSYTE